MVPLLAGLSTAMAQPADDQVLAGALAGRQWDRALELTHSLPAAEVVRQAQPSAQTGVVVGMWALALGYARENKPMLGAKWLYRAWLGMRLDTALCLDARAGDGVAWLLVEADRARVEALGNNTAARSAGIREAAQFYMQTPAYPDPGWSCAWAMEKQYIAATPVILASKPRWSALREAALREFYRRTGLGTQQMRDDAQPVQTTGLPGIGG